MLKTEERTLAKKNVHVHDSQISPCLQSKRFLLSHLALWLYQGVGGTHHHTMGDDFFPLISVPQLNSFFFLLDASSTKQPQVFKTNHLQIKQARLKMSSSSFSAEHTVIAMKVSTAP